VVGAGEVSAGARVHWLLYGVAGALRALPEGVPPLDTVENIGIQGTNGFGNVGYGGPCPPRGLTYHYVFTLYALDAPVVLSPRTVKVDLVRSMQGHVLAQAQLVGRYSRKEPGASPQGAAENAPVLMDEWVMPLVQTACSISVAVTTLITCNGDAIP